MDEPKSVSDNYSSDKSSDDGDMRFMDINDLKKQQSKNQESSAGKVIKKSDNGDNYSDEEF